MDYKKSNQIVYYIKCAMETEDKLAKMNNVFNFNLKYINAECWGLFPVEQKRCCKEQENKLPII